MSHPARCLTRTVAIGLAALAAGCGASSAPTSLLAQAANRIGRVRAGELLVSFTMAPGAQGSANTVGFTMQGSFALDRRLSLPLLHVTYTQLAGSQSRSTRIDSNGTSATIQTNGRAVPLDQQQKQALASTLQGPAGLGSLPLHIDRWVAHPREQPGPTLGGDPTEQVTGELNLPQVLGDLNAISAGGVDRARQAAGADGAFQKALRSSEFLADIDRSDHLLRRIFLRATLVPAGVAGAAHSLTITLNMVIDPRPLPG